MTNRHGGIDLQGQVFLITGAGTGIGAALTRQVAARGARITLTGRRLEKLQAVARGCGEAETLCVAADLTEPDARQRVIQQTIDHWSRIDFLVNNAGMGMYGDFLSASANDWQRLFGINLFAPVALAREVVPLMQRRGGGCIVNIASIGGLIAHADKVTPYVASKHALVGFSRGLAKDLAGSRIRVLAVCPHLTATEFFDTSAGADEMAPLVADLKKVMDTPDAVARGIIAKLDSEQLIVFPTDKPAKAYAKQRDI